MSDISSHYSMALHMKQTFSTCFMESSLPQQSQGHDEFRLEKHRHLVIPKVQVACLKPPVRLLGEGTIVDQGPRSTVSAYLEPKRLVDHVDVRGSRDNGSCTVPDRRPTFVNCDRHITRPGRGLGRPTSSERYAGTQFAHEPAPQISLRRSVPYQFPLLAGFYSVRSCSPLHKP